MKVNQLLIKVRQRLGDMQKISFSDPELMYCLNNAIDRLSIELAAKANPEMIKEFIVNGQTGTERPIDFIALRGQYPIEWRRNTAGNVIAVPLDPEYEGEMTVKYFAMRPHVIKMDDEIPFDQMAYQKMLVTYTLYDVKPSLEGGANDRTGTNEQGSTTGQA